jgi:hypothetical protein
MLPAYACGRRLSLLIAFALRSCCALSLAEGGPRLALEDLDPGKGTHMILGRILFAFRLLLVTVVALVAPVGATSAAAAPQVRSATPASGTWATTSAMFNSTQVVGGTTIIDLTATVTYTGTFTGNSVLHGILLFYPDGSAAFHDTETFTGTVNGKAGRVTFDLFGGSGPAGDYNGTQVIIQSTGALAHLHGVLHQVGGVTDITKGPSGTYTGQIFANHGRDDDSINS